MKRLIIVSDTHGDHPDVPEGDFLVHCGDWTRWAEDYPAVNSLLEWLGAQPHPNKVVIAGNHDGVAHRDGAAYMRNALRGVGATYLQDEGAEIGGLRFYGTPWTPPFGTWRFMADAETRRRYYEAIPAGLDVLVTHGPPEGILDKTWDDRAVGCPILRDVVRDRKPRVHCFGHIHEAKGWNPTPDTLYVNAAQSVAVVMVPDSGPALMLAG